MVRAFICAALFAAAGYWFLGWPVCCGAAGLLAGLGWQYRRNKGLALGASHMFSATFFHLARVDGPTTDAEARFIRTATVEACRTFLGGAWGLPDSALIDEDAFRRMRCCTVGVEAEIDRFARGMLIESLGQANASLGLQLMRVCSDLAAVDGPTRREEREWLEALAVVANLQYDPRAARMLRAVAA